MIACSECTGIYGSFKLKEAEKIDVAYFFFKIQEGKNQGCGQCRGLMQSPKLKPAEEY